MLLWWFHSELVILIGSSYILSYAEQLVEGLLLLLRLLLVGLLRRRGRGADLWWRIVQGVRSLSLVRPSSIEIGEIFRRIVGRRFLGKSDRRLNRWLRFRFYLYFNFWLHFRLAFTEEIGEIERLLVGRRLSGRLWISPWSVLGGSLYWWRRNIFFGNLRDHNRRNRIDWICWISGTIFLWLRRLFLRICFGRLRFLFRLFRFAVCNLWCEGVVLGQSFVFLLSELLGWFHAELFVLNEMMVTYCDYFSLALMSLEISGSILILFSDSSNTLMALMHSVLLSRTSVGWIFIFLPNWAIPWVCRRRWWTGRPRTPIPWCI